MADAEELARKQLEFLGTLGASLCHELRNALAVANEYDGLLADLLAAESRGKPPDRGKMRRAVERIAAQVERGTACVERLGRLAHAHARQRVPLDARQVLGDVTGAYRRLSGLRQVELEVALPSEPVAVRGDLLDLLHLFYRCLELAVLTAAPGETVHLRLEERDGAATLRVAGGRKRGEDEAAASTATSFLDALVACLGARIERTGPPGAPPAFEVSLPRELRAALRVASVGTGRCEGPRE